MTATLAYRTRPTNRRSSANIQELRLVIRDRLTQENPMTVRQVFYQLVSLGAIEKTEKEYKHTVVRLLTDMRHDGEIPFEWIADGTRRERKPCTFSSIEEAITVLAHSYRRAIWDTQEVCVQVWLEKEALADVFYKVTGEFDVPLMVTKGYSSVTFLRNAAMTIYNYQKPTFLYFFGDFDPSGLDITRDVETRLRAYAPEATFTLKRVAVTRDQIKEWNLPTRPTKQTDSRSKNFQGESVEVDAISTRHLRDLARSRITSHLDADILAELKVAEDTERTRLMNLADGWESA